MGTSPGGGRSTLDARVLSIMLQARRILLVDADAFFVAVARQADPEGAGRAALLIVGGRPGSRGVVCSASYECRAFGVHSAMPIRRALALCPDALCVPVPRDACTRRSAEIREVLARFSPVVQASSIDEWYCDLAGTEALYGHEPLSTTAHRIRDAVRAATGLYVSIGCATSRLVAKMAVERAKPKPGTDATGVYMVPPGAERDFLAPFRLADLPMVGPRFAARLERQGLVWVRDVQRLSEETLVQQLGLRAGRWLAHRVQGIDDSLVVSGGRQKQVSREDTFARDLADEETIEGELLRLAVRVSADLRGRAFRAKTVTVKLRTADFRTRTAQRTLARFIASEKAVAQVARHLLRQLRRRGRTPVRLLGIGLSHFEHETDEAPSARSPTEQLALFPPPVPVIPPGTASDTLIDPEETPREQALTRALDRIRARYGSEAILPARLVSPDLDVGPRVEE
jgi:DNA polymerase-4